MWLLCLILYVCVSSPLLLLWIIIIFSWISFTSASQGVLLTFESTVPCRDLLTLGPLPLRSLGYSSRPPVPPFPDLRLDAYFHVCKWHLCSTFAKNESCRVLFFIVFIAFRYFLGGSREDSDVHSHVYVRSPNWYFPNYLISSAMKNIVISLDAFSIKHTLTWKANIFEVTPIAKVQAEEARIPLAPFPGNVQKELP